MIAKKKEIPESVGVILEQVLSERGYLSICREYEIIRKWPSIAPAKLAAVSSCERIDQGVLYIKVSSAAWRQEAVYLKEHLLRRIQHEEGCPSIRDIVFY